MSDDSLDRFYQLMGRSLWYDRQANPITIERWGELRETGLDPDGHFGPSSYVRVGEDTVGPFHVSTVWLGMDHGWGFNRMLREGREDEYRPVIFETMIFGGEHDQYCRRYYTEQEATEGHRQIVDDLRMGMTPGWLLDIEEDEQLWPDAWEMRFDKKEGD